MIGLVSISARLLSSKAGFVVAIVAIAFGLHVFDKRQALAAAREGYVLQVEMAAVQAELDELKRRAAITDEANQVLQEKIEAAEGEARRFADELEAFENDTTINSEGVVDGDLLRRLRSN